MYTELRCTVAMCTMYTKLRWSQDESRFESAAYRHMMAVGAKASNKHRYMSFEQHVD